MTDDAKEPKAFKKHAGGRPTKLTQELMDRIASYIKAGNYIDVAASACGVPRNTLHRWLKEGNEAKSGIKKEFRVTVENAVAVSQVRDVLVIDKAAQGGHWRAAAWRLERKNADHWGRRDIVAVDHGGAMTALVIEERRKALMAVVSDPAKRELLSEMVRALKPARDDASADVIDVEVVDKAASHR